MYFRELPQIFYNYEIFNLQAKKRKPFHTNWRKARQKQNQRGAAKNGMRARSQLRRSRLFCWLVSLQTHWPLQSNTIISCLFSCINYYCFSIIITHSHCVIGKLVAVRQFIWKLIPRHGFCGNFNGRS